METATEIKSGRASEGSLHWYQMDGTPAYQVPRAKPGPNGELYRNTTLADAKKLALLPSVSGILRCAANEQVVQYRLKQLAIAMATSPLLDRYRAGEITDAELLSGVGEEGDEDRNAKAAEGTACHEALERMLRGEKFDPRWQNHCVKVMHHLRAIAPDDTWVPEVTFANPALLYGGKIDARSGDIFVDFKTCEPWDKKAPRYDDWPMQLMAYGIGCGISNPRCISIVISRDPGAQVEVYEYTEAEKQRGWSMFDSLRMYWLAKTGLDTALQARRAA